MKTSYEFKRFCLVLLAGLLIFSSAGYSKSAAGQQSRIQRYPIASNVQTTAQRTVVPGSTFTGTIVPKDLCMISKYKQYGYGAWTYGGPLVSEKRNDIMSPDYVCPSGNKAAKLLNFFTISDIHISDKESPVQFIYLQNSYPAITSAYSPVMLYTTHVLDAAVQTVNALHKKNPIDFGISLGDAANATQYNELRWYIDVLDGKVITPSSGAHHGAGTIDYQKPYKAAGLDKKIKWYQAIGNHDHFLIGTNPVTDYLRPFYTGENVIILGDFLTDKYGFTSAAAPKYYMGVIDGSTPYGNIIDAGPVTDSKFNRPPKVVADPNRRSLLKYDWMKEFFNTSSSPVGHGFTQTNLDRDFACYSFQPKSTMPIKVIVLDDTQRDDDANVCGYGHGSLDKDRYDFLVKELDDGQAAGQLMIIAAHVPIAVEYTDTDALTDPTHLAFVGWSNTLAFITQTQLIAKLQSYPNLIMWVAGHRHLNTVKAFISPDPAHPEFGFWQVETSSLRDFPQQFRTFEISLNSDYTISIVTTNVDPAVKEGTPAWKSRKYAVATQQIVETNVYQTPKQAMWPSVDRTIRPMPNGSYNATLYKQLCPKMVNKMKTLYPGL